MKKKVHCQPSNFCLAINKSYLKKNPSKPFYWLLHRQTKNLISGFIFNSNRQEAIILKAYLARKTSLTNSLELVIKINLTKLLILSIVSIQLTLTNMFIKIFCISYLSTRVILNCFPH